MPKLTKASKAVAQELLDWDLARVAAIKARGVDVSVYQNRQRLAQATLAADQMTRDWPREVVDLFMTVLEVNRTPAQPAMQYGVGRVQHPISNRGDAEVRLLKKLAKELNVIANLREVSPEHWSDDEGEVTT